MLAFCRFCAELSLPSLVALARKEVKGPKEFPLEAFYQHQPSFAALEASAAQGCSFCLLILECFKGSPAEDTNDRPWAWPEKWVGETNDLDASMYAVAQGLTDSSVRIAISADHVYVNASLEDVKVYDTLLVQVGPKSAQNGEDTGMEWELPALPLTIVGGRDHPLHLDGVRIGQFESAPDLAATENFEIAREWLHQCSTQHEGCPSDDAPVLPTRVLDVGASPEFLGLRVLHSHGKKAPYVALSHCWGGKITPLLTTDTLESFSALLPFEELPANFKDAITITREMGMRYLWIDSLCIIQDSKEDWAQESVKMANIYRDACFTISALSSPKSTCGILTRTERLTPESPQPCVLEVASTGSQTLHRLKIMRADLETETLMGLSLRSPLASRGWCLQEAILSPRHLYYGKEHVYWRCLHGFQDTKGSGPGRLFPFETYLDGAIAHILFYDILRPLQQQRLTSRRSMPPDPISVLDEYYTLAQDYSSRTLTFGADKLPAFSGITSRLHRVLGGHYLAGLWSRDIARGLSWRAEGKTVRRLDPARAAPSWSWVGTDEIFLFDGSGLRGPAASGDPPLAIQLLDHDVELDRADVPHGQVKAGRLMVRGLVKRMARSAQVVDAWPCRDSLGTVWFDAQDVGEELGGAGEVAFYSVFVQEATGSLVSVITTLGQEEDWALDLTATLPESYVVLFLHADLDEEDPTYTRPASGLLLVPENGTEAEDVYKRVGIVRFDCVQVTWLMGWERRTLTLI